MVKPWMCLSDPSNSEIPAFLAVPEPTPWQPGEEHSALPGTLPLPVLIIIPVVVLAAITLVLIRVLNRSGRHEDQA